MDNFTEGSTYNITKLFLNKLAGKNPEVVEFFAQGHPPPACAGCCNCFIKGESHCPHAGIVQPAVTAIEEADLVILIPVLCYGDDRSTQDLP